MAIGLHGEPGVYVRCHVTRAFEAEYVSVRTLLQNMMDHHAKGVQQTTRVVKQSHAI